MTKDKLSYKISKIIKSAIATAALPIFIIYIMVAKPDYAIMNGMAHIVLPVANAVGAVITWPIRAVGHGADWVRETANLRSENERLRLLLDEAQSNKNACDVAIAENKKLENELNVKKTSPFDTVVANIQFEDAAFYHSTFLIDKGRKNGLEKGMVVVSFENRLVGTIMDCGSEFCRVRSLSDSDTNIAVRIAGTDISGFLHISHDFAACGNTFFCIGTAKDFVHKAKNFHIGIVDCTDNTLNGLNFRHIIAVSGFHIILE